jgi:hypothetical protein
MLHDGALLTGIAALLFSIVTATTAMIAVLAPPQPVAEQREKYSPSCSDVTPDSQRQ